MIPHRLYVGCIGEGVFRSLDHGVTFKRAAEGMFVECDVRALVADPRSPQTLYLGSEDGVFVSTDGADNWRQLPAPVHGAQVWSLALHGSRLLAGLCPAGVIHSEDGGESWQRGTSRMELDCPRIRHTRVTTVLFDPQDPHRLWAGVEIDGVHTSTDAGQTWERIGEGLSSADVHALAAVPLAGAGQRMLATTNRDLNLSEDGGKSWRPVGLDRSLPWLYCRGLVQRVGQPEVVLVGCGDGPPGSEGAVGISHDGGLSWQPARMPGRSNSTIWTFAVNRADAMLVYAASVSGEIYRSLDGGESWEKLPREFGEVRALAWAPS